MLLIDEIAEQLKEFGLTFNQAKIYLAILRLGETSVEPVSKLSKVRREDVYRALPRLYQIGIVQRNLGTHLKVKAVDIRNAMDILMQEKQIAIDEEMANLASLSRKLVQILIRDRFDHSNDDVDLSSR